MFRRLRPEKAYVTEDVFEDRRAATRVEHMMSSVEGTSVERVSYADLNDIAPQRWTAIPRWGANPVPRDPDVVMTMGKFWPEARQAPFRERYPNLAMRDLWGFSTSRWRRDGELDWRRSQHGCVCQSAWELRTVWGCPFRCAYCELGGLIRLFVNIEEYVGHLDEICSRGPFQRIYKWDNTTDISAFEPEYDASRLLVDYFAEKSGKYLEIYVGKSDNIANLLPLDHKGKSILQWSVAARSQATRFEPETAPWDRRIEAARTCQEAGYIVRFRFSPIIPVRDWKEENAELIARIFERTNPDVITLCPFGWMDVETARSVLDFDLLDPDFVAAMESAAPFLEARGFTSGGGLPIPHDARAHILKSLIDEIRKHNRTIPVSLCLETVEMWALFGRELGMPVNPEKKAAYYCNCGPLCTPENPYAKGVEPGKSWFDAAE